MGKCATHTSQVTIILNGNLRIKLLIASITYFPKVTISVLTLPSKVHIYIYIRFHTKKLCSLSSSKERTYVITMLVVHEQQSALFIILSEFTSSPISDATEFTRIDIVLLSSTPFKITYFIIRPVKILMVNIR